MVKYKGRRTRLETATLRKSLIYGFASLALIGLLMASCFADPGLKYTWINLDQAKIDESNGVPVVLIEQKLGIYITFGDALLAHPPSKYLVVTDPSVTAPELKISYSNGATEILRDSASWTISVDSSNPVTEMTFMGTTPRVTKETMIPFFKLYGISHDEKQVLLELSLIVTTSESHELKVLQSQSLLLGGVLGGVGFVLACSIYLNLRSKIRRKEFGLRKDKKKYKWR